MKKISVILPVYNVERYVEKCIRSIESQDLQQEQFDIICVNDGSPDNSREVIIQLQKEFGNIKLIDQENQGVSVARNKGLEAADSQYVLFIDPDDYVAESSLKTLLDQADKYKLDMLLPSIHFVDENGKKYNDKIFKDTEKIVNGIEAYYLARKKKGIGVDSFVGIVFRKDFLISNKLFFTPGVILNQDVELLARIHDVAQRCMLTDKVLYIAVARKGSATRSNQFNTERVRNGFMIAAKSLKQFQENKKLTKEQKVFLNGPIVKFVLLAIYSAAKTGSFKILKKTVRELYSGGFRKLDLYRCSKYNTVCGKAYNVSPYLSIPVIYVYQKVNLFLYVKND